jgi:hypothetical protein
MKIYLFIIRSSYSITGTCFIRRQKRAYTLKVLTIEKRGGLKVVALDRSPFKLLTLRFSNKSVQVRGPIL